MAQSSGPDVPAAVRGPLYELSGQEPKTVRVSCCHTDLRGLLPTNESGADRRRIVVVLTAPKSGAMTVCNQLHWVAGAAGTAHVVGPLFGVTLCQNADSPVDMLEQILKQAPKESRVVVVLRNAGFAGPAGRHLNESLVELVLDNPRLVVVLAGHLRLTTVSAFPGEPLWEYGRVFIKPDLSPDQVRLFDAFAAACRVARFPENIVSRVGGHPYLLQLLYSQLRRGEMSREAVAHLEQIVFGEGKRLVERGVEVLRNHANNGVRGDIEQVLRDIEQGGVATIVGNLRAALLLYSAGILRPELASDNTLTFGCRNGVAMDSVMREIGRKPRSSRIPITPRMQSIEIEGISAHSCGLCEAPAQVTISFETVGNDYCPPWRLPRYFVDVDGFNDRLNGIREILNDRESNPGGEREFTRLHNLLVGMVPRDLWDRAKAGADTYITTNLVEVPWELLPVRLRDKDDFGNQIMGLVCPVGRAIRTVSISSLQVEPKPMNRSKGAPLKALVVGGGRSHPDNIEVEEVCNALVSIGFEKKNIDVHKGYDWPRWMADTIDKGKRRQYDVFHLVAHGSESLQDARHAGLDHALGCLRLTRDTYISADGIRHLLELVAFRFAFVNVCHAASQVSLGNFSPVYNLLQKGTMVVAPLWAVAATDAAEFATHFYFGLQDHTVGEAIRRTRLHVAQNPSGKRALNNFWASYVLYGDPRIDLLR